VASAICEFMNAADLKFGRLDFVVDGNDWAFLEVNPNGQYGWLDDESLSLHHRVLDAILDPDSTLPVTAGR
jgi:hypothetical protein